MAQTAEAAQLKENTMYALVNTFDGSDRYLGSVVSLHRTVSAADNADAKLQRAVQRKHGSSSYIPTVVVELTAPAKRNAWVEARNCRTLTDEDGPRDY